MRVLVTGAGGFIGGHLVPALAESGHSVFAAVRSASAYEAARGVETIELDLTKPLDSASLPKVDCVMHLAQANVPFPASAVELYRVNTVATQELLDYARNVGARRFVYASSGSVYGQGDSPFREDDELPIADFYAVTKINSEQMIATYRDYFDAVVFRFFMPYGPGQVGRLIPALIDRVREGRPVTLNDGGRPSANPIYVGDVVRVIEAAIELDGHHVINVGGDEVVGIGDLARLIGEIVGREPEFEESSGSGARDIVGDTTRMHELLSVRPLIPLATGLRETVAAFTREVV